MLTTIIITFQNLVVSFQSIPPPHLLQAHDRLLSGDGQPSTPDQFSDFEDVVLPSVDEFHLEDFDQDQDAQQQNLDDFGHSLFVG